MSSLLSLQLLDPIIRLEGSSMSAERINLVNKVAHLIKYPPNKMKMIR